MHCRFTVECEIGFQQDGCSLCKPEIMIDCYSFVFINVCSPLRPTTFTLATAEIREMVDFVKRRAANISSHAGYRNNNSDDIDAAVTS